MFEVATEQIIKVKIPKLSYVYEGVLLVACILAATTIPATGYIGVALLIAFGVCTYLVYQYYNCEIEYSLVDDSLTIDKIMGRSMRKRCGVYNMKRASLVSNLGTQDELRMQNKELRTFDYTKKDKDDYAIVVYAYDENNEMTRFFIEPNMDLLNAIKDVTTKDAFKVEMEKMQTMEA